MRTNSSSMLPYYENTSVTNTLVSSALSIKQSLIVSNDESFITLSKIVFEERDHLMESTLNPRLAWDLEEKRHFDLIFFDLDSCSELKMEWFFERVQLLSNPPLLIGLSKNKIESESTIEALDDFITLPINYDSLKLRIIYAEKDLAKRRDFKLEKASLSRQKTHYQSICKNIPFATLIVSPETGKIEEWNEITKSILSLPEEQIENSYLSSLLPNIYQKSKHFWQSSNIAKPFFLEHIIYTNSKGEAQLLDIVANWIPWEKEKRVMLTIVDSTSKALRQEQAIHKEKSETARIFSSGITHDLDNVLTTVNGSLQLLSQYCPASSIASESLKDAQQACEKAQDLSEKLLAFSAQNTPKHYLTHPTAVIKKTVCFTLLKKQTRPEFYTDENLCPLRIDPINLTRALRHITINASEAMSGQGTLAVESRNITLEENSNYPLPAGEYVRLLFRDQGEGISPENKTGIFDPYFTTKENQKGFGLSIASKIIQDHGGLIHLASSSPEGSCIEILLPAVSEDHISLPDTEKKNKARILFMDDTPEICSLVEKMLTLRGFDAYTVSNGPDAIEVYERAQEFSAPFDLVLLDFHIQNGMNGIETLEKLKDKDPNIKALLLTGNTEPEILENHHEHGFLGVIKKPFQNEVLLNTVEKLLAA